VFGLLTPTANVIVTRRSSFVTYLRVPVRMSVPVMEWLTQCVAGTLTISLTITQLQLPLTLVLWWVCGEQWTARYSKQSAQMNSDFFNFMYITVHTQTTNIRLQRDKHAYTQVNWKMFSNPNRLSVRNIHFIILILLCQSHSDWTAGFRSPTGAENFSSNLCVQTSSGAHPASCTVGTGGSFPRG
jgi:hypothetical protein